MKRWMGWSLVAVLFILLASSLGLAQQKPKMPPDYAFEQQEKSPGKVTLSHDKHWEQVPKCTECHTKVFKMKKGTTEGPWSMARMEKGELCGTCHNDGKKSPKGQPMFSVKEKEMCSRCHTKA